MTASPKTILLVDPDARALALLKSYIAGMGQIVAVGDGPSAMSIAGQIPLALVVTELYLPTGDDECLIHAMRRDPALQRTRVVAHTHRATAADREWATRVGADAYLIKPTRAQRVRYVVSRLTGDGPRAAGQPTPAGPMTRRDSLDAALVEIEAGGLLDASTIVFARRWWEEITPDERQSFRARARKAHVNLRSDSMLGNHFVEVRGASRNGVGLSTERPESPYRR